jgi:geranylgeranyl pyrophosphate synthase
VSGPDDFQSWSRDVAALTEAALSELLPAPRVAPARLHDAMRYSTLGGGKRVRAMLVYAAGEVTQAPRERLRIPASAIEMVHAYSLIHDDLPCMDDDDVRRGRPTVHRVYGVSAAAAAGLVMVPLAARGAYRAAVSLGLDEARRGEIVRVLMRAAGAGGMIGGQLLDLESEGLALSLARLERVHRAKTGELIAASARLGAVASGAGDTVVAALSRFGASIGLAFQIADDVLDVTSTTDQLGKTAGRDAALQKSTYPALLGVQGALARADALVEEGCAVLDDAGLLTAALEQVARYVVARRS